MIKIWLDDVRIPPSNEWVWIKSVNTAKRYISMVSPYGITEIMLSVDHDAGDFAEDGGDYINLLNWFEERQINIPIHIHSMNPVGAENMRRIIRRNGWEEV